MRNALKELLKDMNQSTLAKECPLSQVTHTQITQTHTHTQESRKMAVWAGVKACLPFRVLQKMRVCALLKRPSSSTGSPDAEGDSVRVCVCWGGQIDGYLLESLAGCQPVCPSVTHRLTLPLSVHLCHSQRTDSAKNLIKSN